jgi:two-component system, NtrC family, sensor kinase
VIVPTSDHLPTTDAILAAIATLPPAVAAVLEAAWLDRVSGRGLLDSRFARLVDAAADAIFTVDDHGHITALNPALAVGLGRPSEELIGQHISTLVIPEDRVPMTEVLTATLSGMRVRRECRYVHADGSISIAEVTTAPIVESGRVVGGVGTVRDMTEARQLIAQLVRQERLAALGQLVSGVAHELNNPLTGISAHAQLLELGLVSGTDARETARVIASESRRAAGIARKLLDFVRQTDADLLPVDLNAVVRDSVELRAHVIRSHAIVLDTRYGEALPQVVGNPSALQQVLINLLTNAEQAILAMDGERRITIETEASGGLARVLVTDSGPGIPPEDIGRIFNPFFTTKPRGVGTGLGLSISEGIVRDHGGRLLVHSTEGVGSTFIVELPAQPDGDR